MISDDLVPDGHDIPNGRDLQPQTLLFHITTVECGATEAMIGHGKHFGPYSSPKRRPEQWTKSELEAFVRANEPALDLARQGLSKACVYPLYDQSFGYIPYVFYEWELGFKPSTDYIEYSRVIKLARTLIGEAKYYGVLGDLEQAVDANLDCIELGVMVQQGAPLVEGLEGSAIEAMGTAHLHPRIAKLRPENLELVAKRLQRIQAKRAHFSAVLLAERDGAVSRIVPGLQDPGNLQRLADPRTWLEHSHGSSEPSTFWGNARYAVSNKAASLRRVQAYFTTLAAEQRQPYTGRSNVPVPRGVMASGFITEFAPLRAVFAQREAMLVLIQTEVALRRYRFDHERYPDKLDDVMPRYLKSVPVDPFGLGKPLRYKPLKNGREFLLYSLGPNLKDDGGVHGKWEGADSKGDIVAGKS